MTPTATTALWVRPVQHTGEIGKVVVVVNIRRFDGRSEGPGKGGGEHWPAETQVKDTSETKTRMSKKGSRMST
jgi:hypothetical protein